VSRFAFRVLWQHEHSAAKNPRSKKPKPGSAKGNKIVQQNLSDAKRITKGVPDKIKLGMADAIMAFSDMEMSAEQFIWDLLGLSADDGKLVTRIDSKDKIELAKKFSERYRLPLHPNEQTTAEAWSAIRNAIEARNRMAHGVWMTIDLKTPIVVSYRIPIELGQINSEHFPLDRIEAVTRVCIKAKGLFDTLCAKIATEGAPASPSPPSPRDGAEFKG
jgi:hypothetical protein